MGQQPRIFLSPPHMSGKEQEYIRQAFEANYVAPVGPQLDLFERRFAEQIGVAQAVAVASGTAALHLALRHLNVQPDDEVICSTFTFCASANPIMYERAKPVFLDSDATSWNMDPQLLDEELAACKRRGKLPRAIIAVDILGQCADVDAIQQIAAGYDVPVIQDAAESLGASYRGRPAGATSWCSAYSFNGNKIITTSGGGMLTTNDTRLADHARFLATQARDPAPYYLHSQVGYNYRLSNISAAIGLGQLDVLDERVAARRRHFSYYQQHLSELPGVAFMPQAHYGQSNCWLTAVQIDPKVFGADCEQVRQQMEAANIEARRIWKPLHTQPVFVGCRYRGGRVAEDIFDTALCLPSGSAMTEDDLQRVIAVMRAASKSR